MSCIASAVSRRIAAEETSRKVRPPASNVDTPSVVTSRYGVSVGADRQQVGVAELGTVGVTHEAAG